MDEKPIFNFEVNLDGEMAFATKAMDALVNIILAVMPPLDHR